MARKHGESRKMTQTGLGRERHELGGHGTESEHGREKARENKAS